MALVRELREEGFRGLVRRYEPAVRERIYHLVRDRDLTEPGSSAILRDAAGNAGD